MATEFDSSRYLGSAFYQDRLVAVEANQVPQDAQSESISISKQISALEKSVYILRGHCEALHCKLFEPTAKYDNKSTTSVELSARIEWIQANVDMVSSALTSIFKRI